MGVAARNSRKENALEVESFRRKSTFGVAICVAYLVAGLRLLVIGDEFLPATVFRQSLLGSDGSAEFTQLVLGTLDVLRGQRSKVLLAVRLHGDAPGPVEVELPLGVRDLVLAVPVRRDRDGPVFPPDFDSENLFLALIVRSIVVVLERAAGMEFACRHGGKTLSDYHLRRRRLRFGIVGLGVDREREDDGRSDRQSNGAITPQGEFSLAVGPCPPAFCWAPHRPSSDSESDQ